jgi:hypothetical protein
MAHISEGSSGFVASTGSATGTISTGATTATVAELVEAMILFCASEPIVAAFIFNASASRLPVLFRSTKAIFNLLVRCPISKLLITFAKIVINAQPGCRNMQRNQL